MHCYNALVWQHEGHLVCIKGLSNNLHRANVGAIGPITPNWPHVRPCLTWCAIEKWVHKTENVQYSAGYLPVCRSLVLKYQFPFL